MTKPGIPKGTRDFGPREMARRNWMFAHLRAAFERRGFLPIETPAMEQLSTLTGKYGEEGDQLIFKILNNGDFLEKADATALQARDSRAVLPAIAKKALRYDLTVPFARFVTMARNELTFPFRRYQMQQVWRGDRPGRGRYQEFTQCDADIIGSASVLCEWEVLDLFDEVLTALGVPGFQIVVNDRRVLNACAAQWGVEDRLTDFTVALDKWDKVGTEGVLAELETRGLPPSASVGAQALLGLAAVEGNEARLGALRALLGSSPELDAALEDLAFLTREVNHTVVEPWLARGLNYYTGMIVEVRVPDAPVGSICGGGRYADLTGVFGWPGMSGVGVSFGADRIYDVLEHFGAFPEGLGQMTTLLVARMDAEGLEDALSLVRASRAAGVSSEVYPDAVKLGKQLSYAADLGIPFVALAGSNERALGVWTLRDMATGTQTQATAAEVVRAVTEARGRARS
jgi:histidyl-tRNA synthetase